MASHKATSQKADATCEYCGLSFRRDYLKIHIQKIHQGLIPKEQGQLPFSFSYPQPAKRAKESENLLEASSGSQPETPISEFSSSSSGENLSEKGEMVLVPQKLLEEFSNKFQELSSYSKSPFPSPLVHSSATTTSSTTTTTTSRSGATTTSNITTTTTSRSGATTSCSHSDEVVKSKSKITHLKILVRNAKSLEEICTLLDFIELKENANFLYCKLCHSGDWSGAPTTGVFSYDFNLGTHFEKTHQPQDFRNIKMKISRHLETPSHLKQRAENENLEKQNRYLLQRNYKCGITVGKAAYRLFLNGQAYEKFEEDMAYLHDQGNDIGELNHSRMFPPDFLKNIYEIIKGKFIQYLNTPLQATKSLPPVCLLTDKFTKKHTTYEIVAILTYIPGASSIFVPLILELVSIPSKNHTGQGLTEMLISTLQRFSIQSTQITGGACDGQYIKLKVHEHLSTMYNLPPYSYFTWDLAHRLNLVDIDARKNPINNWLKNLTQTISNVFRIVNFGKGFEELIEECELLNEDVKMPTFYSNTRFAEYANRSYKNFLEDFHGLVSVLQNRATRRESDNSDIYLGQITQLSFLLGLAGLIDIYENYQTTSKQIQDSTLFSWDAQIKVRDFQNHLQNMSLSENSINCLLWPKLYEVVNSIEFEQFATYKNVPLAFVSEVSRTRQSDQNFDQNSIEESKNNCYKKLQKFCTILSENIEQRFFSENCSRRNEVLKLCLKIFNFQAFYEESKKSADPHIPIICSEATNPLFLEILNQMKIPENNFQKQLFNLKQILLKSTKISKQKYYTNLEFLGIFLQDPEFFTGNEEFLNAYLTLALQSHNEAIVESMGSKIQYHARPERNLSRTTLNNEIFVAWQGPPVTACTTLVENALDLRFGTRSAWHFVTSSRKDVLHKWTRSKVVDRVYSENKEAAKLPFLMN